MQFLHIKIKIQNLSSTKRNRYSTKSVKSKIRVAGVQGSPSHIILLKFVWYIFKNGFLKEFLKVGKFNSINQFITIKNIFYKHRIFSQKKSNRKQQQQLYLFTGKKGSFFELEPLGTEYVCWCCIFSIKLSFILKAISIFSSFQSKSLF